MFKKILLFLLILIIATVGAGYFYYDQNTKPVSDDATMREFEVLAGSSVDAVTKKLEDEGFIRNALITKFLISQENFEDVKAGSFEINPAMSPQEIFSVITDSSKIIVHTYRMTFIPGEWAKDYAQVIARHTDLSAAEVLAQWNDPAYVQTLIESYEVLTPEILNDQTRVYLEGYFAPNTYEFYMDATLDDITRTLLAPTETFYQQNKTLFDQSHLSVHEVFNLSSMVQFEASQLEDQQLVASVFLNRLNIGMNLESSVTLCYALYEYDNWTDCERNPQIESPYNTYKYAGLPVGPIANPTHNAIFSVLTPVESNYYFFVADVFGVEEAGKVHFAETYEQHLELVRKYLEGRY